MDGGHSTTATGARGFAWRPGPETRLHISDNNARTNVFLKVAEVEDALERTLDEHLCKPLQFRADLDLSSGLAASLKCQLDFLMHEFQRSEGVADNPIALASTTDLVISLALRGAAHNYSDRLDRNFGSVLPAYVRRAEDFMRAHCAEPIRMAHVAAAAGCSVGTLSVVFRRFRGKTPLGTLHAIRLEQARSELIRGENGATIATVARRHGFTNAARFTVAFRQRFNETPSEAMRHAPRS